ncbi:transposase [Deinococcus rubellus]|uniref:transposase n=1 Tax=Deinococcus rubellus TaxID=1889240 RepID=UPI0031E53773
MTASKREYTAEFKEEAVRLVISSQKSCSEIARNLGISPHLVTGLRGGASNHIWVAH